jgi:cytochrome c biogenesis protein CcmG, thiol:disulfide interchange protein DsbE
MRTDFMLGAPARRCLFALLCGLTLPAPVLAAKLAPVFDLPGATGAVSLADYRGKVVYLDFWASWCGPCRQSFPWMNRMQSQYGKRGLQIIGVNLDANLPDAKAFLKETPAEFVIGYDPKGITPRSYGVKGMPTSVLIGADGQVIYQHVGFTDADRAELERQIKLALQVEK